MAFTIKPDGTITVDTPEELGHVLALREQRSVRTVSRPTPTALPKAEAVRPLPAESVRATVSDRDSAYRSLYEESPPPQQRLLKALLGASRMLTDVEVRTALGLGSNLDLRGLMIGIIRRASYRGIPSPIKKEMTRSDSGRKRHYRYGVTSVFRRAVEGVREGGLLESA